MSNTYLRPAQLAERWGCAVNSLANKRSRNEGLPHYKIGASVLYKLSDIEAYEAERRVEPANA